MIMKSRFPGSRAAYQKQAPYFLSALMIGIPSLTEEGSEIFIHHPPKEGSNA